MSNCGETDAIWRLAMGNAGGCGLADHPNYTDNNINMPPQDQERWTCGVNGDIALDLRSASDAKICNSWSTEGSCQFPMNKLMKLQATLESSGCQGLWAAPLWISPQNWIPDQWQSGEIDIFERGCIKQDGYLTSFGNIDSAIKHDSWKQQGQGFQEDSTSLTAYITFSPGAYDNPDAPGSPDQVAIYRCAKGANPIEDGDVRGCDVTLYNSYYKDTKDHTKSGTQLMTLISDVWNQPNQGCTGTSALDKSNCNFKVSDIKLQFTEDWPSPFQGGNAQCDAIWHKVNSP